MDTTNRHDEIAKIVSDTIEHMRNGSIEHIERVQKMLESIERFRLVSDERLRLLAEKRALLWSGSFGTPEAPVPRVLSSSEQERLNQINARLGEICEMYPN